MSQEQGLDGPAPAAPWSAPDTGGDDPRDAGPAGRALATSPAAAPEPPDLRQRYDRIPLRPLGIGDLLDGTFNTIRRNPRATVGLAALLVTLQQVLAVGFQLVTDGLPTLGAFAEQAFSFQTLGGFGGLAGTLLAAVVGAVLTGMLVVVVSDDVIGRQVSASDVWRRIRPRVWALLVAAAIAGILPYLGLIFLVAPGLILWAAWALTTPALVLEGLGPFAALRRSWQLAWPDLVRVWWVRTLSVVVGTLMQLLIAIPFTVAGAIVVVANGAEDDAGSVVTVVVLVLSVLGAIAAGTVTAPFLAGVLALLYLDRRMRAEGLDLVLRRQLRTAGQRPAVGSGPAPGGGP
jgi:hypothetical protein